MKIDFQNSNHKFRQAILPVSLTAIGLIILSLLWKSFSPYFASNQMTSEQEFSLIADISKEENHPIPPYVYFLKETPYGGSRSILYLKGKNGEDVFVMLNSDTSPKIKMIPENAEFTISRQKMEDIANDYTMSDEVRNYLKSHALK